MKCKYCDRDVPEITGGHRAREYCNNACKQAYYRQQHGILPKKVDTAHIEELERDLQEAQERIRKLERQLDIEQRFLYGTEALGFKTWLKKHRQSGLPPVGKKLLDEEWLEPRGSRSRYEAYLRKAQYSVDDIQEFRDLWRLMLLEQSYR